MRPAHSVAGYFVTNGSRCFFVLPNLHSVLAEQQSAIAGNVGIYFDFNQDGFYDGDMAKPVGMSIYAPLAMNSGEYYMFTDYIDISNLLSDPTNYPTWETEIETYMNNNFGGGFDASLVWGPVDPLCRNTAYYALVAEMTSCPTVSAMYYAQVPNASATTSICVEGDKNLEIDFEGIDLGGVVPTLGQWGLIILDFGFWIFGFIKIKEKSPSIA